MLEITYIVNNFKKELKPMDPRPYHFDYRKPRLSNPTFQSTHFYESIFSSKDALIQRPTPRPRNPYMLNKSSSQQPPAQMKRAASTQLSTKNTVDLGRGYSYRYGSKDSLDQLDKIPQSKMANYGSNVVRNTSMDQTQVYKRQEKQFNIISFYPKEYKPNLRQFPKLTLQNRLIQIGKNPTNI